MTQEQKVQKVKAKLGQKALVVKRVLATDDGKDLMRILRQEFTLRLDEESPHGPAYRVGTAAVVGYIDALNDFKEE